MRLYQHQLGNDGVKIMTENITDVLDALQEEPQQMTIQDNMTNTEITVKASTELTQSYEDDLTKKMNYCTFLAKSNVIPQAYQNNPSNVFVALEYGANLGLKPLVALNSIAVVNGKPCVFGDTLKALCMKYGKITEEYNSDKWEWVCTCEREGYPTVKRSFSLNDALIAGLVGKGSKGEIIEGSRKSKVWVQYPVRMIQMRARSYALRDAFPDILQGIITTEEAKDYDMDI